MHKTRLSEKNDWFWDMNINKFQMIRYVGDRIHDNFIDQGLSVVIPSMSLADKKRHEYIQITNDSNYDDKLLSFDFLRYIKRDFFNFVNNRSNVQSILHEYEGTKIERGNMKRLATSLFLAFCDHRRGYFSIDDIGFIPYNYVRIDGITETEVSFTIMFDNRQINTIDFTLHLR